MAGLLDPMLEYRGLLAKNKLANVPGTGLLSAAQKAYQHSQEMPMLRRAAMATAPIPVIGDVLGLADDAATYMSDAQSRTPLNFGLTGLGLLPFIPGMTAFHGSPHRIPETPDNPFGQFDMSKIGTGEGAQAFGHGIYLAENPGVAKSYRDIGGEMPKIQIGDELIDFPRWSPDASVQERMLRKLGDRIYGRQESLGRNLTKHDIDDVFSELRGDMKADSARNPGLSSNVAEEFQALDALQAMPIKGTKAAGNFYTVDLPDEHIAKMLDWDKPLSEQPENVKTALREIGMIDEKGVTPNFSTYHADPSGEQILRALEKYFGTSKASAVLKGTGVPGVRYYDGGSRAAAEGTRNFVIFDPSIAKIINRE